MKVKVENLATDEETAGGNRSFVLQNDSENSMDAVSKQRGSLKERMFKKRTPILRTT